MPLTNVILCFTTTLVASVANLINILEVQDESPLDPLPGALP